MPSKTALLIVDPLKDFCPGGSLATEQGAAIMPRINELARSGTYDAVVLIREMHPEGHISFASRHGKEPFQEIVLPGGRHQMLWPDHCVETGQGHEPHPDLDLSLIDKEVRKGRKPDVENYSGFADDDGEETGLHAYLREQGIGAVDVVGIAIDYCVKETACDAASERYGYRTRVLLDACAGVGATPEAIPDAKRQMAEAGAEVLAAR
ncbi:MAG: nicotinamidase [Opitutales bacterium]